jgi:hypothetical protein
MSLRPFSQIFKSAHVGSSEHLLRDTSNLNTSSLFLYGAAIPVFQNWMTLVDYVWPPASSEYFLCSLPTFGYVSQDGKLSAIVLMEILL